MGEDRGADRRASRAAIEEVTGEQPTVTMGDVSGTRIEAVRPQPMPIPPLEDGTRVGRYVIIEQLGSGGVGVVYKAYDPELDRAIALKLLRPERRHSETAVAVQARMLREAQALAKLSHPNVVAIYDVGSFEGDVFLAMEYVQGQTLRDWIKTSPPLPALLDAFVAAGRGLAAAHDAGLVHRDFKPANVWMGDDDRVRVLDFGLARMAGETGMVDGDAISADSGLDSRDMSGPRIDSSMSLPSSSDSDAVGAARLTRSNDSSSPMDVRLTRTGALMGTPRYMAPEQHRGEAADQRTDQFSFCIALFESLYGKGPFAGRDIHQLRHAVLRGRVREVKSDRKIPPRVRRVVMRGLSLAPADRYPDMRALLRDLERSRHSPVRLVAAAAIAATVLGVGVAMAVGSAPAAHALCESDDQTMLQAWNPRLVGDVRRAFVATGKPYAERNHAAFVEAVDDYAVEWKQARKRACERAEQPDARPVSQARLDCLGERADELAAFVDVYRDGLDADALAHAVPAAHRLTSLEICASAQPPRQLARENETPPDPRRVTALRRQLARARGLTKAGHDRACVDVARPALAEAEALGDPALRAQTRLVLGNCLAEVNELEESRAQLERAVQDATESGHPAIETEAWLSLVGSVGIDDGRPTSARAMLPAAEAAFARAGSPWYLESRLLSIKALIFDSLGDYRAAIEMENEAIALTEEHSPKDAYAIAVLHNNVGVSYARVGDYRTSERHLRKAIALNEAELGPDHPLLGNAYNTLGGVLYEHRDPEAAEAAWRRSLAIREAAHGADHPLLGRVLPNLAMLAFERRDFTRAQELLERALSNQSSLGPSHPESTGVLLMLADVALEHGAPAQAEQLCQRAEGILAVTQVAATHEDRPYVLTCKGRVLVEKGSPELGITPLQEAIALFEGGDHAADPRAVAQSRATLARAMWTSVRDRPRALINALQALAAYADLMPTPQVAHERAQLLAWLCARRDEIASLRELPNGAAEALRCDGP